LKWFKNILLIPLHVIDSHFIMIFSSYSFDYVPQKSFQFENQACLPYKTLEGMAQTNHFKMRF